MDKHSKSRYSSALSELIHGKPNLPRDQQPCMFDIMSWGAESRCDPCNDSLDDIHPPNCKKNEQELQRHKEKPQRISPTKNNQNPHGQSQIKGQVKKLSVTEQQQKQRFVVEKPIHEISSQPNPQNQCECCNHTKNQPCTVHGIQIKPDLYSCQKRPLRKSNYQERQKANSITNFEAKIKSSTPAKRKLDSTNEKDRKIISQRKRRIKDFKMVTRDLPNSSSVTYFGKPVFEAYGRGDRGNSTATANIKSHNVMPHRGENHPKYDQSYDSALIKGKKVHQECHIPRKPFADIYASSYSEHEEHQPINLPLESPDLINCLRFSAEEPFKKKQAVPKQSRGNLSTRQIPRKNKNQRKNKKQNKSQAMSSTFNDGLKFMNKRDNLIQLLQEKKTKKSKLAFKVTECYPLPWNCSETCQTNPFNADWERIRPAGKEKKQTEKVSDLLKQNLNQRELQLKTWERNCQCRQECCNGRQQGHCHYQ